MGSYIDINKLNAECARIRRELDEEELMYDKVEFPCKGTNRDVLKAVFPNKKFTEGRFDGWFDEDIRCSLDWLNAPYKAEPKAELNAEMKAMLGSSFYNR